MDGRGTASPGQELQEQIELLREQVRTNRQDIDELQADGLLESTLLEVLQERGASQVKLNEDLRLALTTSRTIGVAIGIMMARELLTQDAAFQVLRKISNDTNRKLRDVAEEIVATGETAKYRLRTGSPKP